MDLYTPITRQLTLFDFNALRPRTKIPMKRITRERYNQAMLEMKRGEPKTLLEVLRDINQSLDNYNRRLSNK